MPIGEICVPHVWHRSQNPGTTAHSCASVVLRPRSDPNQPTTAPPFQRQPFLPIDPCGPLLILPER